jgi:glycerophosphoryl diester phosphodiesterase
VVTFPAGGRRGGTARDLPKKLGGHTTSAVQVIGHAGLAIQSEGGAPTRRHLEDALELGVDRIELDVCCTADGQLVVRHDVSVADGRFVADLELAELGRAGAAVLRLDEVVEHLGGRVPLLLDIKMGGAAELLGPWLRRRRDPDTFAVCTENLPWLLHLRFAAPRVARWPSFPDLGDRRSHHVQRVVVGLWRSHASLDGLRRGLVDVQRAARHLRERPQESLANLAGMPWRGRLPMDVAQTRDDIAAAGMCVHHWVVSERLVEEAHSFGLHVNTWTVNNPFAARTVAAAGVDSITTDRVHLVRVALQSQDPPDPRLQAGRPVRAVVRIAPS